MLVSRCETTLKTEGGINMFEGLFTVKDPISMTVSQFLHTQPIAEEIATLAVCFGSGYILFKLGKKYADKLPECSKAKRFFYAAFFEAVCFLPLILLTKMLGFDLKLLLPGLAASLIVQGVSCWRPELD
jgi:hypothetical protein